MWTVETYIFTIIAPMYLAISHPSPHFNSDMATLSNAHREAFFVGLSGHCDAWW